VYFVLHLFLYVLVKASSECWSQEGHPAVQLSIDKNAKYQISFVARSARIKLLFLVQSI